MGADADGAVLPRGGRPAGGGRKPAGDDKGRGAGAGKGAAAVSEPIQPISRRFPAMEEQEVELTCFAPEGSRVEVAGTFNGWRPEANPLEHREGGEYAIRLMLKSGQYEYRFVVDGAWVDDPRAALTVRNSFSGLNSVLEVGLDDRTDLL